MLHRLLKSSPVLSESVTYSLVSGGDMHGQFVRDGLPVGTLALDRAGKWGRVFRFLWHLVHDRPRVLCTWLYHADLAGTIAWFLTGVPVIWNLRSTGLVPQTPWRTKAVLRINTLLSHIAPSMVIACSRAAVREHKAFGYLGVDFIHIPNSVDTQRFRFCAKNRERIRRELGIPEDVVVIGFVGRFHPQKNLPGFFSVAQSLLGRGYKIRVIAAGSKIAKENDEVAAMVQNAGVSHITSLLGPRPDVEVLYPAMDVLIMSSLWGESFPNVVAEAMASERVCVSYDVGDASAIIGDEGHVVKRGDIAALTERVAAVCDMSPGERLKMGEAAKERVVGLYSMASICERYEAVLTPADGVVI